MGHNRIHKKIFYGIFKHRDACVSQMIVEQSLQMLTKDPAFAGAER